MKNVRRVDVLEAAQRLVDERLEVGVAQRLARADLLSERQSSVASPSDRSRRHGTDDRMQVGLHQLLVQVDLVERARSRVLDEVEVIEASDLPSGSSAESTTSAGATLPK